MAKIQLFISNETLEFLEKNFKHSKSRLIDALLYDFMNGRPLSSDAISRLMNKNTYDTKENNNSGKKKKVALNKKNNSFIEEKIDNTQLNNSTNNQAVITTPQINLQNPSEPIYKENVENLSSSTIEPEIKTTESIISSNNLNETQKSSNISSSLIMKGLSGFGL